jgi:predicted TIM-barrel fold metal-dependent hydrolase
MSIGRRLFVDEYTPVSELVVEQHNIGKPKFPAFDAHAHFGSLLLGDSYESRYDTAEVVSRLKDFGLKGIVNLDGWWGSELDRMLAKVHPYEDFIKTFGCIDPSKLDEPDFEGYVRRTLRESAEKGMKGLKFWKNISLVLKDSKGKYIPIDDDRLKVIWQTAAELKLPVLIHIADPVAFFKPIDEFNERYEELGAHPDWSFYGPQYYSFQELIKMQENLLAGNPDTTFIVAHFGSCAENIAAVGNWLDKYSNMYVDIAARISELGRQPYSSKKFLERYQDRILFGTDFYPVEGLYDYYPIYYRFLETMDEYFDYSPERIPNQGRWKIYGIGLGDGILEKLYYKNAEKLIR